ncbi:MAG: amidase family protein, partial [Primorskyibacter sp.]
SQGRALSAQDIHDASALRTGWAQAAQALFAEHDALILPAAQVWPFDKTLVHPTEIAGQAMDTYHRWMEVVVPASVLGLPAVSVPVGFGGQGACAGLPMGVQIIGPPGSDARLLQIAQCWHRLTGWSDHAPACVTSLA